MTYKKIIENQIDRAIDKYVQSHTDEYKIVNIDSIELTPEKDSINFVCKIKVYNTPFIRDYRVSGYMDEWGRIYVCNVTYSRFFVTGVSFPQNKMFFVHGDELDTFKFDM